MKQMMIPGRILVIDDVPDEVTKIVESLRLDGENVLYTSSMPDDRFLDNVRLIIMDLFLVPNDKMASYEMAAAVLEKLSQRTEFFIVAIWTKVARNSDEDKQIITDLRKIVNQRLLSQGRQTELQAVFLDPFGKSITQVELVEKLIKLITSRPDCSLLLEIENSIEQARDRAVSDIVTTASLPMILNSLREEVGDTALNREMINLFLRILARHARSNESMSKCMEKMRETVQQTDAEKYGQIHSLQAYYAVDPNECVWTGDVLEKGDEYAIVMSPACDFAQYKTRPFEHIKLVHGFRINHADLINRELKDKHRTQLRIKDSSFEACVRAVFEGKSLQKRFYVLRYLKDSISNKLFHLVLDFHQVSRIPFKATAALLEKEEKWKRLCRIDNPAIDDLLHEYAAYSSRVGVPRVPEEIVKSILGKANEQQK